MLKFKCDALLRSDIEMWHLMSEMPAVRPQQDVLPGQFVDWISPHIG